MMKLATPVLVFSVALVAACTVEDDKRAGARSGTGGTSSSGGSGGASTGGSGGSGSGGATGSGGSVSGTGGSGTGGGSASGSGGRGGGSGSGGGSGRDSGGGGSEAGAPDTGSSNPGAMVFKNTCEYPVMSGFMPSEFCPAYAEICTFTGTGRYASLADCMAKFKGGASDGDACKAGHLCRALKAPSMKEADCASSGTAACRN
jgi:hypothetical protein